MAHRQAELKEPKSKATEFACVSGKMGTMREGNGNDECSTNKNYHLIMDDMKQIFSVLLLMVFSLTIKSETVLFTNGPNNFKVDVPTNKAIMIHEVSFYGTCMWSNETKTCYVSQMSGESFGDKYLPIYGVGPLSLIITNSSDGYMSYAIVPANSMQTMLYMSTGAVLQVEAGQKVKLISFGNTSLNRQFRLKRDPVTVGPFSFWKYASREFDGPLEIHFLEGDLILTYQIIENARTLPGNVIEANGMRGISVEKSKDLETWSTAISVTETKEPKTFYRLKVDQ